MAKKTNGKVPEEEKTSRIGAAVGLVSHATKLMVLLVFAGLSAKLAFPNNPMIGGVFENQGFVVVSLAISASLLYWLSDFMNSNGLKVQIKRIEATLSDSEAKNAAKIDAEFSSIKDVIQKYLGEENERLKEENASLTNELERISVEEQEKLKNELDELRTQNEKLLAELREKTDDPHNIRGTVGEIHAA